MRDRGNKAAEAIPEIGEKEFLKYGCGQAFLRRAAGETLVTAGAIHGYFPDRGALFEALTRDTAKELVNMYMKTHRDLAALAPDEQPGVSSDITGKYVLRMVNFIHDHSNAFRLSMCYGAPGVGDGFFDRLITVEGELCWDFVNAVKTLGHPVPETSDMLTHILRRSFFQQFHEFVSHDIPKEQAIPCSVIPGHFQHAG